MSWIKHFKSVSPFVQGIAGGVIGGLLIVGAFFLYSTAKNFPFFNQEFLKPTSLLSLLPDNLNKKTDEKNSDKTKGTNKDQSSAKSSLLDVSDIVEKVNPAVVSIVITKDVPVMEQYFVNPFGENSPFQISIPRYRSKGTQSKEVGGGSGFLISADGYLVTNAHVVNDPAASYTVFLTGGKKYSAKVITLDDVLDIALLKIEESNLPFLEFGNSDQLKLGQSVVAIGNALGEFRNTVSTGVISGLARSITAKDGRAFENLDNLIQTDAAINPGNSGGPLIDSVGQVIGVNVAVAQGSENVGFALPANMVKQAVESMKTNGKVVRPFLGIRYLPITSELQKQNQLTVDYGVLVVRGESQTDLAVIPGSPANKAGVVEYDIILEADGQKIDLQHPLASTIRKKKIGDILKLKILHNGVDKDIQITLEESKDTTK